MNRIKKLKYHSRKGFWYNPGNSCYKENYLKYFHNKTWYRRLLSHYFSQYYKTSPAVHDMVGEYWPVVYRKQERKRILRVMVLYTRGVKGTLNKKRKLKKVLRPVQWLNKEDRIYFRNTIR